MQIAITEKFTDRVLFETEVGGDESEQPLRIALQRESEQPLRIALQRASLDGASLNRASLDGAVLDGARLVGARLDGARLDGARLVGAILNRARGRAQLESANLTRIRKDLYAVLAAAPAEVPALLAALREGRVNGSVYEGPCACLLGTIANARGCSYTALDGLRPNASRPAERWFLALKPGYTPETSPIAAITADWISAWRQ